MKRLIGPLLLASLAAFVGCNKEGTSGGPGVTDTSTKPPMIGRQDNTFALTTASVSVKPGAAATVSSIGIKRGTGFDQDVSVEFADLPKGVTIDPASATIAKSATEAKFNVTAAESTTPGDYTVKVVGKPATGGNSTGDFKLTVKTPDTFSFGMPLLTTGIKQGETKAFSFSVKRDSEFREDVALKFENLPKGVVIEPTTVTSKNGETETKLMLKAAEDAPLGDHVIKVTGQPTKGNPVTQDLKINVSKK
jgi:hypothetical protein